MHILIFSIGITGRTPLIYAMEKCIILLDSCNLGVFRVALPFCRVSLKAARPSKIPRNFRSLGDHIKKRRLGLGLYHGQVAEILGIDESSVSNWEKRRTAPTLRAIPKITEFLGYVPGVESEGLLGARIKHCRRMRGMNEETSEKQLGVDPATLGRWERGKVNPGS